MHLQNLSDETKYNNNELKRGSLLVFRGTYCFYGFGISFFYIFYSLQSCLNELSLLKKSFDLLDLKRSVKGGEIETFTFLFIFISAKRQKSRD